MNTVCHLWVKIAFGEDLVLDRRPSLYPTNENSLLRLL